MKKVLALVMTFFMILCMLSGCSDSIRVSDFDLDIGDEVIFGKYHGEEIEWLVIGKNFLVDEGKIRVELLSKYALDCKPFNDDGVSSWEECSLRKWLNDDFYKDAFSLKEQKQIAENTYFNVFGGTRFFSDKVYLIDFTWFRMRFKEAVCEPTEYAEDQGIDIKDGKCSYWGREVFENFVYDSEESFDYPLVYGFDGNIAHHDPDMDKNFEADDIGVRPVICVDYKAAIDRRDIEVGNTITLGSYSGDILEWIVVDNDLHGVTMISRYGLDDMRMDKGEPESFEESSLHDWLNDEFYNDAFNAKQKKRIISFDNDDYVSLIGFEELKSLLKSGTGIGRCFFTGYYPSFYAAHPELKDEATYKKRKATDIWWMRDIAKADTCMFYVYDVSDLTSKVEASEKRSVRPMIKIEI